MGWVKRFSVVACAAVLLYCLKQYMLGPMCESKARIDGKVVIITGANTGIGKETAVDLLDRGAARVYMACRSVERASRAAAEIKTRTGVDDSRLIVLQLDLNSLQSVHDFAKLFKQREKKLDILINNAGIMYAPFELTPDGFESTFGVNHLAHFLLTHLLMDELMAATSSRIINVSSMGHAFCNGIDFDDLIREKDYSRLEAYHQSKLANVLFTRELARRLKGTGVTTYSLHPGAIFTELGRHIPFLGTTEIGQMLYYYITWFFVKDPIHGAQTQICCSVDEQMGKESGYYYSDCARKDPSPAAQDDQSASRLWDVSVRLVKLAPTEIHAKLR